MNPITLQEIERWLKETNEKTLETLWARADEVRKAVHIASSPPSEARHARQLHSCCATAQQGERTQARTGAPNALQA